MNDFLVSILIPFYNSEKFMHISLDAAIKQTYKNIEIICLDDGSTDNTYQKLLEYQKQCPNIRVYKNEKNSRISYSRNRLISLAKGKYFFFLDSDDSITPNAIETLVNYSKNGKYDIVAGKSWLVFSYKKINIKLPFSVISSMINKENNYKYVKKNICLCWMNLFKKEFWDSLNVKFLENCDFEDFGLIPYVFLNCKSMFMCPKRLYYYKRRHESVSDFRLDKAAKKIKDMLRQFDYLVQLFFQNNQLTSKKIRRSLNGILLVNMYAILTMRQLMKFNKFEEIDEIDELIYHTLEKSKIKLKYSKTWWKSITYFYNSLTLWFEFKKIRLNKDMDAKGLIFWKYRKY